MDKQCVYCETGTDFLYPLTWGLWGEGDDFNSVV